MIFLVFLGSASPLFFDPEDFFLLSGDFDFDLPYSEPFLLLSDYYSLTNLIPGLLLF